MFCDVKTTCRPNPIRSSLGESNVNDLPLLGLQNLKASTFAAPNGSPSFLVQAIVSQLICLSFWGHCHNLLHIPNYLEQNHRIHGRDVMSALFRQYISVLIISFRSFSAFYCLAISSSIFTIMASRYQGRCYCGDVSWSTTEKVGFTSLCHCKDCQTLTGSAFGSTSLIVHNHDGEKFQGKERNVFHSKNKQGHSTQR